MSPEWWYGASQAELAAWLVQEGRAPSDRILWGRHVRGLRTYYACPALVAEVFNE